MAVSNAMFVFEVVIENVKTMVESRHLIVRSEFADIFSFELRDPKHMHIVMPEPPPLPPDPPGKKKKKPPKPKKGKKGKVEEPPPEPVILSGQSVLFTSNPEFLIQNMRKFPMEVSVWSKEDNFSYIGASLITWDAVFIQYLQKILNCERPPPVILREEYNIFEEGTAKLMAKVCIQVKLSYLADKVTTEFRTLTEDPLDSKVLYTGLNSKTTSYMITVKSHVEDSEEENPNKTENNIVKKKPTQKSTKPVFADYKNAPGANLTFFGDRDYCCLTPADKVPESIYKAPKTSPDIEFINEYIRKIIVSCNDNMRMLTPQPTKKRKTASEVERLCYCKETQPDGTAAEGSEDLEQSEPCPECKNVGKSEDEQATIFAVANIRGPCGKPDCRVARHLRAYIENLVEEDNREININDIIGPCGSKKCTLAQKIQEFLRHEGVFGQGPSSAECECVKVLEDAMKGKESDDECDGINCPLASAPAENA